MQVFFYINQLKIILILIMETSTWTSRDITAV